MKRNWTFFIAASTSLVFILLILNVIKKKVFVTIDLEVSNAKLEINEDVLNFFSLQGSTDFSQILVSALHHFKVSSTDSGTSGSTDTVTVQGRSIFNRVAPGSIELKKDNRITVTSVDNKNVSLLIEGLKTPISLYPVDSSSSYTFDEGTRNGVEVDDGQWNPLHEGVAVLSNDSVLSIRLIAVDSVSLSEENVFSVTPISFTRFVGNKEQPGILAGKVHIEETGKDIILYKNDFLSFGENDHLTVTSLSVQNNKIKLRLEGFTNDIKVGVYGDKYIPSLLEYFSKNNQLALLFNSFMVVITFLLFLKRETSTKKE